MSGDGGSSFQRIHSFSNDESVIDSDHSEQRMAFLSSTGGLYHTRPRALQILRLGSIPRNASKLVFDSLGELNAIGVHAENKTIVSTTIPLVSSDRVSICDEEFANSNVNGMLIYFTSPIYIVAITNSFAC